LEGVSTHGMRAGPLRWPAGRQGTRIEPDVIIVDAEMSATPQETHEVPQRAEMQCAGV
jgi:hypothetical protein